MYPKGVIYQAGYPDHGEANLYPSPLNKFYYQLMRGVGAGLIGFALIMALFTYGPVVKNEIAYRTNRVHSYETSLSEELQAQEIAQVRAEAESYGVDAYFSIVIPKIGAAEKIVANVSLVDKEKYLEALQQGVAHARGTSFPGQGENIYLFSHSTDSPLNFARYNAVFYLLNKLEKGDLVIIFFADQKYVYQVMETMVTDKKDLSWLAKQGKEVLTLQTCSPPGTTLRRLVVLAEPVDN